MHRAFFMDSHRQRPSRPPIPCQHRWLGPIEIPSILNCDDRVPAGSHIEEGEAAIEVGLVASESIEIRFWIFWNQNHHGAVESLAHVFGKAINRNGTLLQGDGDRKFRARRDIECSAGSRSSLPRHTGHGVVLCLCSCEYVILAWDYIRKRRLSLRVDCGRDVRTPGVP